MYRVLLAALFVPTLANAQVATGPLLVHDGVAAQDRPTISVGAQTVFGIGRGAQMTGPARFDASLGITAPLTPTLRLDAGLTGGHLAPDGLLAFGDTEGHATGSVHAGLRHVATGEHLQATVGGGLSAGLAGSRGSFGGYAQAGISPVWRTARPFADVVLQQMVDGRGETPRWLMERTGVDLGNGAFHGRAWVNLGLYNGRLPDKNTGTTAARSTVALAGWGLGASYTW